MKTFDYNNAVRLLKLVYGEALPKEKVTIYTICTHVSKSGMSRDIKALLFINNQPYCLGFGRIGGCGMDMGFHCAYTIVQMAWGRDEEGKYKEVYQDILEHRWL